MMKIIFYIFFWLCIFNVGNIVAQNPPTGPGDCGDINPLRGTEWDAIFVADNPRFENDTLKIDIYVKRCTEWTSPKSTMLGESATNTAGMATLMWHYSDMNASGFPTYFKEDGITFILDTAITSLAYSFGPFNMPCPLVVKSVAAMGGTINVFLDEETTAVQLYHLVNSEQLYKLGVFILPIREGVDVSGKTTGLYWADDADMSIVVWGGENTVQTATFNDINLDIPFPSDGLNPPDLALDTVVCAPAVDIVYNVALPSGADTCIWSISGGATWVASDSGKIVTVSYPDTGNYVVSVYAKNASSQSTTVSKTVHAYGKPSADLEDHIYACAGSSAAALEFTNLTPAGTGYVWLKSDKTTPVNGSPLNPQGVGDAGDYWLALEDVHGCKDTLKTTVGFNVVPTVTPVNPLTACGDTLELQVAASVGTVKWLESDKSTSRTSTQVVNGVDGTDFWVYAVAGHTSTGLCYSDTLPVHVLYNTPPTVVVPQDPITSCGDSVTLTAMTAPGAALVWLKEDNQVLGSNVAHSSGIYRVYATETTSTGTCTSDTVSVSVHLNTRPSVTIPQDPITSCGNSVTLTAVTAPAATLVWMDATKTPLSNTTVSADGIFYVYATETAATGTCVSDTVSVSVNLGTNPSVTIPQDPITSCGNSVTLMANTAPAASLTWLGPDGTPMAGNVAGISGIYKVYATEIAGANTCVSDTVSVAVSLGTNPSVTVPQDPITSCGNSVTLTATTAPGATLVWLDNSGTPLGTNIATASGTYRVYANAVGCVSDTVSVTVNLGTRPSVTVPQDPITSCGSSVTLMANTAPAATLVWLDNSGTPLGTNVVTTDGLYQVYASEGSCVSDTVSVSVNLGTNPSVTVPQDPITSCGSSVTLMANTAPAATLVWLDNSGALLGTNIATASGTYRVYASEGSCVSDTVSVSVDLGTRPSVTVPQDPITSCGSSVTLMANTAPAATLVWLDNSGTPLGTNVVTTDGLYQVYASEGSCVSDTVSVSVNLGTNPSVTIPQNPITSCGSSVTLMANTAPGATLVWLDNSGAPLGTNIATASGTYQVYASEGSCVSDTVSVSVNLGTNPSVTIPQDPITSCGNSVTLMANTAPAATLVWLSGTDNSPLLTNIATASGTYRVYASEGNCVSDTVSVTVNLGTNPSVTIPQDPITSCGSSVTLTANTAPGATLVWLDNSGAPLGTNIATVSGTYQVYASEGSCVSDTVSVTVNLGTNPSVTIPQDPITSCGNSVTLMANTAPAATLVWLDNSGAPLGTNIATASGTYRVYASEGSCVSDTVSVTVNLGTNPSVTIPQDPITSCGNSVTLMANTAPAATLVWLDNSGTPLGTNIATASGTYRVYASEGSCVSDTVSVSVDLGTRPSVTVPQDPITSCGNSVTLTANTAPAATLVWLDNTGAPLGTNVVTTDGLYQVYASEGSCVSDTVSVSVNLGTNPSVTIPQDPITSCGNSVTLMANTAPAATLVWLDNSGAPLGTNIATASGTYQVYASEGSCVSDTVSVSVDLGTRPSVTVPQDPITSCGNSVTLTANTAPAATLVWLSGTDNSPLLTNIATASGTYRVYASEGNCVSDTVSVTVNLGTNPSVTIPQDPITSCGSSVTLTANTAPGATLVWLDNSGAPLGTNVVTTDGLYQVYASEGSCVSDTVSVSVNLGTNPSVTIPQDPITSCGNSVTLTANTAPAATLVWLSGTDNSPLLTNIATVSGTYRVYASEGSCKSDTVSVSVNLGTRPSITIPQDPLTSCGNSVTLTANTAPAATLVWLDNSGVLLGTNIATVSGTYQVYASEGSCVSDTVSVTVNLGTNPSVTIPQDPITSCGSSVTLMANTAPAATLVWLDNSGAPLGTNIATASGTYRVYASEGSCVSDTVSVTVNLGTNPSVTIPQDPLTSCGNSVTLTANTAPAATLVWLSGTDNSPLLTNIATASGTYRVYASEGSCVSDTVSVNVNLGTNPSVTVPQDPITSCGSSVTLMANTAPGATLVWLDNSGAPLGTNIATASGTYQVYASEGSCVSDTVSVTVNLGTNPNVTIPQDPITSCGSSVTLTANTASGATLVWLDNSGTPLGTNIATASGTYQVYASEGSCVSDTLSVTVNLGTNPSVTIPQDPLTSCGSSVTLMANTAPAATLVWLDNSGAPLGTNIATASGTYQVYASEGSCVSDTLSVNVNLGTNPSVTVPQDPITSCGSSVTLTANTASGATLVWLDNSGAPLGTNIATVSGTYQVYASEGSCVSDTVSVTVNLGTNPSVTIPQDPLTSCGSSVTLMANTAPAATLVWLDNSGAPLGTNIATVSGTYQVYASEGSCVSDTVSVTVNLGTNPSVTIPQDPITSCGSSVTLMANTAPGATLVWLDNSGAPLGTNIATASGTYQVYASEGSCVSDTVSVTVNLGTNPSVTIPQDPITSCGSSVTLMANTAPAATLVWLDNSGAPLGTNIATVSGTYQVYANEGSCVSDTVSITVNLGTNPSVTVPQDPITSCGSSVTLMANTAPAATLVWLDNSGAPLGTNIATASGTYQVYASEGSCVSDTVSVSVNLGTRPSVTIPQDPITSCGSSVTLMANTAPAATLVWLDNSGTSLGTNIATVSGTYRVYASEGSCVSDTVSVSVDLGTRPSVTISQDPITSCGSSVTLMANTAPGATLVWLDNSGAPLGTNIATASGTYQVYANEGSCVSDTVSVSVNLGTNPSVTIPQDPITSCGSSVTLMANTAPAATLVWLDNSGAPLGTNIATVSGTYQVYASEGSCMSDTLSVNVSLGTSPVISLSSDTLTDCGSSLTLTGATAPGATLVWLDAANQPLNTNIVSVAGDYYVYASAGGCYSDTVKVTVRLGVKPAITVAPEFDNCSGDNVNVALTSLSDNSAVVKWFDNTRTVVATGNPAVIMNAVPGNYLVVAEGGLSCVSDTAYFTVKECGGDSVCPIDATAVPSVNICVGNTVQLNVTTGDCFEPVSYAWSPAAGLSDSTLQNPVFTAVAADAGMTKEFYVTVTDAGGKTLKDTVNFAVGANNAPVLAGLTDASCIGDTIMAMTDGSVAVSSFKWYVDGVLQPSADSLLAMTDTGTYQVKVVAVAQNGCLSDVDSVEVKIDRLELQFISFTAGPVNIGSPIDGQVQATGGSGSYTYNWTSPYNISPYVTASGESFNLSAADNMYYFRVYAVDNTTGCRSLAVDTSIYVTGYGNLDIELTGDTVVCQNGAAMLTVSVTGGVPGYTYEWYEAGNPNPVQVVTAVSDSVQTLFVTPVADQKYYVKVKDSSWPLSIGIDSVLVKISTLHTAITADAGPDMTISSGSQTTLLGGDGGGAVQQWIWTALSGGFSSAAETSKQYPLTAHLLNGSHDYILHVRDNNNCLSLPDTATVKVDPNGLNLVINPSVDTLCLGNELLITVREPMNTLPASAVYTWTPALSNPPIVWQSAKGDSIRFNAAAAGDYTYVASVVDGTRQAAVRTEIHVDNTATPDFTLAVSGTQSCQFDTIRVQYNPGSVYATSYEWYVDQVKTAVTDSFYVVNTTGTHTYEVVAGIGACAADRQGVQLTSDPTPTLNLSITDSCGMGVVVATGTGATVNYTYTIDPLSATVTAVTDAVNHAEYQIGGVTDYTLTVTASNGTACEMQRSVTGVVHDRPALTWSATWGTKSDTTYSVLVGAPDVTVSATANGGQPYINGILNEYEYHWFGSVADSVKTAVSSGYALDASVAANHTLNVYAIDSNRCISDTLKCKVIVQGSSLTVDLTSVYGDTVCQNGAAMLVAHAGGGTLPFRYEWYELAGPTLVATHINGEQDTFFVPYSALGDYYVMVSANSGAIGADTITTLVAGSHTAPEISAGPDMTIQPGHSTALLGTIVSAGDAAVYNWHWSPVAMLATPADTAYQYPQTAQLNLTPLDTVTYHLYVTDDHNCVSLPDSAYVIVDNDGICVTAEPENTELCLNNTVEWTAELTCGSGSDTLFTWSPKTHLKDWASDSSSVVFVAEVDGTYEYAVKAEVDGKTAAARVRVKVDNKKAPVLDLQGAWDCINDSIVAVNTGEPVISYQWALDHNPLATPVPDSVLVLTSTTGKHFLEVYAMAANGCASDTVQLDLYIGTRPSIEFVEADLQTYHAQALYKDSIFTATVDPVVLGTAYYELLWTSYDFHNNLVVNKIDGKDDTLKVKGLPMDDDVAYIFTATDTVNSSCFATDTLRAYIIPDTLPLDIDKAGSDIVLKWNIDSVARPWMKYADSIRIMHNRWDGYAVANPYTYYNTVDASKDSLLVNIANDTLEFFYANASRYIEELSQNYYSFPSDTVGYFKQWVSIISTDFPDDSYNYFVYPFDMKVKGLVNMTDLAKYFGTDVSGDGKYKIFTLSSLSYSATMNTWGQKRLKYNKTLNIFTGDNSDLVLGKVYQVRFREAIADKSDIELLLYGKLPSDFAYDLYAQGSIDKYNMIATSLFSVDSCWLQNIGNKIPDKVSLQTWTFMNQSWRRPNKYADYNSTLHIWNPQEINKKLYIKPWTVIQSRVKVEKLGWKFEDYK